MLSNKLKKFITLRRVMGVLLLCCAQHIAQASEVKPILTASELSEDQLFSYVMDLKLAIFIANETADQNFELTPEQLKLSQGSWREIFKKRGAIADPYVLKMLSYYLDETTDIHVITSLQCRRGRILADLRKIKKRGPQCDPKYQKLCADQDLWKIRVADIDSILSNKNEVHQKYCTTELYSPEVMQAPLKRK